MALKCCICGNKIGFTEPLGTLSSQYSNMKLCSKCMNKKRDLESPDVELYTQSIEYFKKYKESIDLDAYVLDVINSWISKGENRLNKNVQETERLLKEKNIMLTTGYNFEGYSIVSYLGLASGDVVLGTGFLSEFSASVSDFLGEKSKVFANKMIIAKQAAKSILIKDAVLKGGNAIIGINFDYITFSNNIIGISVNGTIVIIEESKNRNLL